LASMFMIRVWFVRHIWQKGDATVVDGR
jgi:hypothetical protein